MKFTAGFEGISLPRAMPLPDATLQTWVVQQLEMRGIDAVVYSRYIFSLLQQDEIDPFPLSPKPGPRRYSFSDSLDGLKRPVRPKSKAKKFEKSGACNLTLDELKKMEAVKCLLSAADEISDVDIKSFIDELYMKLKGNSVEVETTPQTQEQQKHVKPVVKTESATTKDNAQRYYDAFPALSDRKDVEKAGKRSGKLADKVWARVACRSNTSDSSEESCEDLPTSHKGSKSDGDMKTNKTKIHEKIAMVGGRRNLLKPQRYVLRKMAEKGQAFPRQLPGVESPNFRMYTFKGKSIDHIKGKALFKDVEGDIGPPAKKEVKPQENNNVVESIVQENKSTSKDKADVSGLQIDVEPTFLLPKMPVSPVSAKGAGKTTKRQPLYLRRCGNSTGKLGKINLAIASRRGKIADFVASNTRSKDDYADTDSTQTPVVDTLLMDPRPIDDLLPNCQPLKTPDTPPKRLYERKTFSQRHKEKFTLDPPLFEEEDDLAREQTVSIEEDTNEKYFDSPGDNLLLRSVWESSDSSKELDGVGVNGLDGISSTVREQECVTVSLENQNEWNQDSVWKSTDTSYELGSDSHSNLGQENEWRQDSDWKNTDTSYELGSESRCSLVQDNLIEPLENDEAWRQTSSGNENYAEFGVDIACDKKEIYAKSCPFESPRGENDVYIFNYKNNSSSSGEERNCLNDWAANGINVESADTASPNNSFNESCTEAHGIAIGVPPNTPVNANDCATTSQGDSNSLDILGLSNLVQLAEQIKSLSQDECESAYTSFFSQELTGVNERIGVDWECLEPIPDVCEVLSPSDVHGFSGERFSLHDENQIHSPGGSSLMRLFDSDDSDSFNGIPTPLSAEEIPFRNAYTPSQSPWSPFGTENKANLIDTSDAEHKAVCSNRLNEQTLSKSAKTVLETEPNPWEDTSVHTTDNLHEYTESYVPEFTSGRFDGSSPVVNMIGDYSNDENASFNSNLGNTHPAMVAAQLGRDELRKRGLLDTQSSPTNGHAESTGHALSNATNNGHRYSEKKIDLEVAVNNNSISRDRNNMHVMNRNTESDVFPSALFFEFADCKGTWSAQAWSSNLGDFFREENSRSILNLSETGLLDRLMLQTTPVNFLDDWMDRTVMPPSPLREYFSPKIQRGESRIWDVNVPEKLEKFTTHCDVIIPSSIQQLLGRIGLTSHALSLMFIEGGVYGKEWENLLEERLVEETNPSPSGNSICGGALKCPEDRFWSCSSDNLQSDFEDNESVHSCVTNTVEILPSANSAFCEFARKNILDSDDSRIIQHVRSEPIISPMKNCTQGLESTYRWIQIRHLYKSETSILRQLGLASGNDDEETKQMDAVEFSPDRHFQPINPRISNQANVDTNVGSPAGTASGIVTLARDEAGAEKDSLSGSWSDSCSSVKTVKRSSSYQLYQNKQSLGVSSEDIVEETPKADYFIPSFRVEKKCEKGAQTGEASPEVIHEESDIEAQKTEDVNCDTSLTQRLLTDMKNVLGCDEDAGLGCDEDTLIKDLRSSLRKAAPCPDLLNSSDYESMGHDTSGDEVSDYQQSGIAGIWDQDLDSVSVGDNTTPVPMAHSVATLFSASLHDSNTPANVWSEPPQDTTGHFGSIWGSYGENRLGIDFKLSKLAGRTFAHGGVGESTTGYDAFSSSGGSEQVPGLTGSQQDDAILDTYAAQISNFEDYIILESVGVDDTLESREDQNTQSAAGNVFTDEENDMIFILEVPEGQRLYSSELEDEWRTNTTNYSVQVPKYTKPRHKGTSRKPCSFYKEGNCRRADCKFAHDTSTITCRFWEEDECFKGVTCPFLHGYYSESPKWPTTTKEKRRNALKSKNKPAEFQFKRDDFPLLSKSQEEKTTTPSNNTYTEKKASKAKSSSGKSSRNKDKAKAVARSNRIEICGAKSLN